LLPAERYSARGLVGVAVGLAGVVVVARPSPTTLLSPDVVGKGLVMLAALSVSLGSVLVRRADLTLSRTPFTAWAMVVGAGLLHVASLAVGESPATVVPTLPGLGALVYIGTFATALAFLIYFTLLAEYGPLEANLVSYLVPVVATVLGAVYLSEPVTAWTVGGFALVLAGFALLKGRELRAEFRRLTTGTT
jgi:drug/metabolite transporter (DMT)-like permease